MSEIDIAIPELSPQTGLIARVESYPGGETTIVLGGRLTKHVSKDIDAGEVLELALARVGHSRDSLAAALEPKDHWNDHVYRYSGKFPTTERWLYIRVIWEELEGGMSQTTYELTRNPFGVTEPHS